MTQTPERARKGEEAMVAGAPSSGISTAGKVQAAAVVVAAWEIGSKIYDRYMSKDDSALMDKFGRYDCGGLAKMPVKIEGCFRRYVRDAIHRLSKTAPWETTKAFYDRFHECFDARATYDCSWWGEDVFNY